MTLNVIKMIIQLFYSLYNYSRNNNFNGLFYKWKIRFVPFNIRLIKPGIAIVKTDIPFILNGGSKLFNKYLETGQI